MQNDFSVSVSVDDKTGELLCVYFGIRQGKVAKTVELADGRVMADYNSKGKLLGIEMIAPCTEKVLDQIDIEEPVRAFLKNAAPHQFIRGRLKKNLSLA
ncbi:MAG: DUF2283 domain-containing protein [Planctomycetes bacterium]|nr:DUF2283 domain-containing protein [Planctomycetota bacterium]